MKTIKILPAAVAVATLFTLASAGFAAETKKEAKKETVKSVKTYPLDKCVVSDEKLDSMGKPYVFTHESREIKLCCESCLKDFKKNPAKYVKKIEAAEKKAKKS